MPRNNFVGLPLHRVDVRLQRRFNLGPAKLDGLLEVFNVFNHANFSNPDGNFTDGPGQFGAITSVVGASTADVNGDPQPGRAVQLAAKFYF